MNGKRITARNAIIMLLLVVGSALLVASVIGTSSFLAVAGIATVFWGVIAFYILPSRHLPLDFVSSLLVGSSDNIERIISEFDLSEKGIYLPPKYLKDVESSLVFVPKAAQFSLPKSVESNEGLLSANHDGVFVVPPGLRLSRTFEEKGNISFTKTDLQNLQPILQKIISELEIAEKIEVIVREEAVTAKVTGSIFDDICERANATPNTHSQVGCLFSSAIACVLAKASGKPVRISDESTEKTTKTTTIDFVITPISSELEAEGQK